jgi:hypothetical protein
MLLFHLLLCAYCAIGIWRMNYGFTKFDIKIGKKKSVHDEYEKVTVMK